MNQIGSLNTEGLASYLGAEDLCQVACKFASLAERAVDEDASVIEQFAVQTLEPTDIVSTHPAVTAFIYRQKLEGATFCSPGFITEILLPYLENVLGMDQMTLPLLLGSTNLRRAQAFDQNPDTKTLILFLESLLQRREDEGGASSIDDPLDFSLRCFTLVHYSLRVLASGKTTPASAPASPGSSTTRQASSNVSPSSAAAGGGLGENAASSGTSSPTKRSVIHLENLEQALEDENNSSSATAAYLDDSTASATNNNNINALSPASFDGVTLTAAQNLNTHRLESLMNTPSATQHHFHLGAGAFGGHSAESSSSAFASAGGFSGGGPPALPKQEPLSGSRRVHRTWKQWLEIGKKAFLENSNLPVYVDGVSYTPCACFVEALEDFYSSNMSDLVKEPSSVNFDTPSISKNLNLDTSAASSIAASPTEEKLKSKTEEKEEEDEDDDDDYAALLGNARGSTIGGGSNKKHGSGTGSRLGVAFSSPLIGGGDSAAALRTLPRGENDEAEAELWSLLSRSMPLGSSAVTVGGLMHTKQSAMAMAVQCDIDSASRWLDLARLLPSETGKKRISKRRAQKSSSDKNKSSKSSSNSFLGGGGGGKNSSSSARRFGSGLGGNSPTPQRRKFSISFSDDFSSPKFEGASPNSPNNNGDDWGSTRRSSTTREVVPTVDGRSINKVTAFSECLKLDPKNAEVWSELGLHMPLHPPFDSVFINSSAYSSRRCHEVALEMDVTLADSWVDLGWQLMEDKKVTAINGQVYSATDCFVEALQHGPTDTGEAWSMLGQSLPDKADASVSVGGEVYTKLEIFHRALKLDPHCISAWIGLGRMLTRGSNVEVNGKNFSQLGLFYHALEMDDGDAVAWNGLGAMLGPVDRAVFRGETLTRRQCYLTALDCDPYLARVWNNLGLDLGDPRVPRGPDGSGNPSSSWDGSSYRAAMNKNTSDNAAAASFGGGVENDFVMVHGRRYDAKACFIRALHCEGGNVSTSWVNLGMLLDQDPEAEGGTAMVCGKKVHKKKCYLEAVRSNERNAIAWNNLGAVMDPNESVTINKKMTKCTKIDCYRNALEYDDTLSNAWYNAVCVMVRHEKITGESVTFKVRGITYNKQSCMLNAVEVNPENGNAWKMLVDLMKEDSVKSYTSHDGREVKLKFAVQQLELYPPKD